MGGPETGGPLGFRSRSHIGPRDLRLVPLAAGAWVAAWVGMGAASPVLIGLLSAGGIGVAVSLVRRTALVAGLGLVVLVVGGLSAVRFHQFTSSPLAELAAEKAIIELEFVVKGDARVQSHARFGGRTVTAVVDVVRVEGRGVAYAVRQQVHLTASGNNGTALAELVVGTTARASGRLASTESGPSVAFVSLRSPPVVAEPAGRAAMAVETVRAGLRRSVADLPADRRALVPALVVGDVSAQTPDLTDDFMTTGLTHLTAVSGENINSDDG